MSEHHEKAHSTFGGSSADRWMNCAGSTALIASLPPRDGGSAYAAEGTAAHALAQHCLENGLYSADEFIDTQFMYDDHGAERGCTPTKEMADAVNVYLDAVYEELALAPDAELYVEQRFVLDIKTAEPGEVFGANDAIVYIPSLKHLAVFDYKHGAGVAVSADDNAQLKFYASGAALSHPEWLVTNVDLIIVQPRTRDAEETGGVKRWTLDPIELIEFAGEAEAAIGQAKTVIEEMARDDKLYVIEQTLSPGKWCRWCTAASSCPAKERQAMQLATLDYSDVTLATPRSLPDVKSFDVARLGQVLTAINMLKEWGKQVEDHVEELLTAGVPVPGWKLVEKVGRRKWIDDPQRIADHVSVMYGLPLDDIMPRKLATITDMEKLLKAVLPKEERKAATDEVSLAFTLKESSGLTLVPASEKREGVDVLARDFGSVILPPMN